VGEIELQATVDRWALGLGQAKADLLSALLPTVMFS
jgi:hypothetical protein